MTLIGDSPSFSSPAELAQVVLDSSRLRIAMAKAPSRWTPALRRMLTLIEEKGKSLEEAYSETEKRMPTSLRGMWSVSLEMPDASLSFLELVQSTERGRRIRREVLHVALYPLLLLCLGGLISLLIHQLFFDAGAFFSSETVSSGLPAATAAGGVVNKPKWMVVGESLTLQLTVAGLTPLWCVAMIAMVYFVMAPSRFANLMCGLPWIGMPWRWSLMIDLLGILHFLLRRNYPLPAALDLAVRSFARSAHEQDLLRMRSQGLNGKRLGELLSQSSLADRILRPLLRSLDSVDVANDGRIGQICESLDSLAWRRVQFLKIVLPVIAMMYVGGSVISMFVAYTKMLFDQYAFGIATASAYKLSNLCIMLPIGLAMLLMFKIYNPNEPSRSETAFETAFRMVINLLIAVGLFGFMQFNNTNTLIFYGLAVMLIFVIWLQYRQIRKDAIVLILSLLATRDRLPSVLQDMSMEFGFLWWWRLQSLKQKIEKGMPLSAALESKRMIRGTLRSLVGRYSEHDQRPEVFSILQKQISLQDAFINGLYFRILYLAAIGLLSLYVLGNNLLMMVQMTEEFDLELLRSLRSLTRSSFLQLVSVLGMIFIGVSAFMATVLFWFPAIWSLPPLSWLFRKNVSNATLQILAMMVSPQKQPAGEVRILAGIHPSRFFRNRLLSLDSALSRGLALGEALYKSGWISKKQQGVVQSSLLLGDPAWGLQQVVEEKNERLESRQIVLLQLMNVGNVILGAIPVFLFGLLVFHFFIQMFYSAGLYPESINR